MARASCCAPWLAELTTASTTIEPGSAPPKTGLPARGGPHDALDRRIEGDDAAAILEVALQRQHVAMAVDDPRLGRVKRGDAEQRGLHPHRIGGIEHGH